jgi:uncharacterized protein (TIGR02757 family)
MSSTLKTPDWDALAKQYATPDFITRDPISFPHAYRHLDDWRHAECIAFLSALFSYGRREKILETLNQLFSPMEERPIDWLLKTSTPQIRRQFKGFYYRFNTEEDFVFLLLRLKQVYQEYDSLKSLWSKVQEEHGELRHAIHGFRERFLYEGELSPPETYGMKFLFADPLQNSAAKRFNMFLRWMSRCDQVDLGLWKEVVSPANLIIPLDTHVAAMARKYRITRRKSNDWKTAEEITHYFRKRCPSDPARYDFALFGLGIDGGN